MKDEIASDADADDNHLINCHIDDKNLLPVLLNEEKKKKGVSETRVNYDRWESTFCHLNGTKP